MTTAAARASFHDPDGSVFLWDDKIVRAVTPDAAGRLQHFLDTGAGRDIVGKGWMPRTERLQESEVPAELRASAPAGSCWFLHERVPFINYPHEWTAEQLLEAGSFALDVSAALRQEGWDIKDGNARNVVFHGDRPVFVDFGSVQLRDDRWPGWRPAGQIHRHFIFPAIAQQKLGVSAASLLLARPDGMEHDEAYSLLRHSRMSDRHVFWLCTLPVWLSRRASNAPPRASAQPPEVCRAAADLAVRSLKRRLLSLRGRLGEPSSTWAQYEQQRTHYRPDEVDFKRQCLQRWLAEIRPSSVLDIGTNGGEYAVMAAAAGAEVVSIDKDEGALRVARAGARRAGVSVLHLLVDYANPTPAVGWSGAECLSFDQRCRGRFDLTLALAVVHHLMIAGRIPLDELIAKLWEGTRGALVVEYVDPADPMFARMADDRDLDYSWLNQGSFEQALATRFTVLERVDLVPGRRALYRCERRASAR